MADDAVGGIRGPTHTIHINAHKHIRITHMPHGAIAEVPDLFMTMSYGMAICCCMIQVVEGAIRLYTSVSHRQAQAIVSNLYSRCVVPSAAGHSLPMSCWVCSVRRLTYMPDTCVLISQTCILIL